MGKKGRTNRTAEEYGIPDWSDDLLKWYAAQSYGDAPVLAREELAKRQSMLREADIYRRALQKSTEYNLGPEYRSGLNAITTQLAGTGPLADSGAKNAMGMQLYSKILQQAQGQQASGMADYIGNFLKQKQNYRYQSMLQKQAEKANKKKWYDYAAGVGGSAAGAYLGGGG